MADITNIIDDRTTQSTIALKLLFGTTSGKTLSVTINNPKETVTSADINEAIASLVATSYFKASGYGAINENLGAQLVVNSVSDVNIITP